MKWVTVASFNSHAEAGPLRYSLEQAGIAAEIVSDSRVEGAMDFARPGAGVQVRVARSDFQRALSIVCDWNAGVPKAPLPPEGPKSQRAQPQG